MTRFSKLSKLIHHGTPIIGKNDTGLVSQKLLLYNGLISSNSDGLFVLSPMMLRVVNKLKLFINAKLDEIGAQECLFPTLGRAELWNRSGRMERFGSEMFTLKDRRNKIFCLQPTYEEEVCSFVCQMEIKQSSLPLLIYQISRKYRDEIQPKLGLLRCREFLMKDLYSFDIDISHARETYEVMCRIYADIFQELEIPFIRVPADGGLMGDCPSDEFHIFLPVGEDTVAVCPNCGNTRICSETGLGQSSINCDTQGQNCTCGSRVNISKSVEIGHCFLLGSTYTSCFDVKIPTISGHSLLQMGCYGIGISRLLGAALEYFTTQTNDTLMTELRWPRRFAPYSGAIALQKENANDALKNDNLNFLLSQFSDYPDSTPGSPTYHAGLLPRGDILLDDRSKLTLGRKLLDLRRLGVPWILVAKNKKDMNFGHELIDVYSGTSHIASLDDVRSAFTKSDCKPPLY